jgi:hypothetical protein
MLLMLALFVSCAENHGVLTLANKASEPITRASVLVCGQTLDFSSLAISGSESRNFRTSCEGDYQIEVEFQSGRNLKKTVGYVTSGFNEMRATLLITDGDVTISHPKAQDD